MQIIIKEMHQLSRRQAPNHNRRNRFQSQACQDRRHFQSNAYRPVTTVECRSSSGRIFKYLPIDTRLRARTFGRRRFATSSKTAMNVNTNNDKPSKIFLLINMILQSVLRTAATGVTSTVYSKPWTRTYAAICSPRIH